MDDTIDSVSAGFFALNRNSRPKMFGADWFSVYERVI